MAHPDRNIEQALAYSTRKEEIAAGTIELTADEIVAAAIGADL